MMLDGQKGQGGAKTGFLRRDLLRISEEIVASHGLRYQFPTVTELVLLEIDPKQVHAYWHIEHADLFRARVAAGDPCASLVLNLCRTESVPGEGWPVIESPIRGLTASAYLDIPSSGVACHAEIGLRLHDGSLHVLVRSNVAHPPREKESPHYEMVPVDTRILSDGPPEGSPGGESMPGPLSTRADEMPRPGSSWN